MDHEDATQMLLRNLGFPVAHRADQIVQQLRAEDPCDQLQALENLSSTLLMSREEGLITFPAAAVVPELVTVLQAPTMLAEIPFLACRIITQLIDRGVPHILDLLVESGILEALHSRFLDIAYIDIVEQAISILEKVAADFPAPVLASGCVVLVLQAIDFFNMHVQRSILNVVRLTVPSVSKDTLDAVRLVVPVLIDHMQAGNSGLSDLSVSGVCLVIKAISELGASGEIRNLFEGVVPTLVSRIAPGDPLLTSVLQSLNTLCGSMPFIVPELIRTQVFAGVARAVTRADVEQGYDSSVVSTLLHVQSNTLLAALNLLGNILPKATLDLPFKGPEGQGIDKTLLSDLPLGVLEALAKTCVQLSSVVYSCTADAKVRECALQIVLQVCCLPRKILKTVAQKTELVQLCCLLTAQEDLRLNLLGLCASHELLVKQPDLAADFGQHGLDSEIEGYTSDRTPSDWSLGSDNATLLANASYLAGQLRSKLGSRRIDMSPFERLVGSGNWSEVIPLVNSSFSELLRADAFKVIADEVRRDPESFMQQWTPVQFSQLVSKLLEGLNRTERCAVLSGAPTLAAALEKHVRMKICDDSNGTSWTLNVQAIASVKNLDKFCQSRLAFYQFMGGNGNLFEALTRHRGRHEGDGHSDHSQSDQQSDHDDPSDHSEHDHDHDHDHSDDHSDDELDSDHDPQDYYDQQLDEMEDELPAVEQMQEEASGPEPESDDAGEDEDEIEDDVAEVAQVAHQRPSLRFYYKDRPLNLEQSILGAIFEGELSPSTWSEEHKIVFKRVEQEEDREREEPEAVCAENIDPLFETPKSMESKSWVLQLLSMLARLNEKYEYIPMSDFMSVKLTSKLNCQLDDPLVVIANILPQWVVDSVRIYPWLYPFESRHQFLKYTSFGYSRRMASWQDREEATPELRMALGRLVKQKYRISRKGVLPNALKVLGMTKKLSAVVEIEYYEEQGTGLGPTLEFYASVSRAFLKGSTQMWRGEILDGYYYDERGVFPRPMATPSKSVLTYFIGLGRFFARALLDERMLDLRINHAFFMLLLKKYEPRYLLELVDPVFAKNLFQLDRSTVESLGLDFTLPDHEEIELVPNGRDQLVTGARLEEYIDLVVDWTVGRGVRYQVDAFSRGFSESFPVESLNAFLPSDFYALCGQNTEDWSEQALRDSIVADHGYTNSSRPVNDLISIMSKLDPVERRRFLKFMTGSPNLPIGGFKMLKPPFTVVLKHAEDDSIPIDDYFPSVMTCANYFKLPSYSSKEVMAKQLWAAIDGGSGVFPLS